MANTVRVKRRVTGLAGAPASLLTAELAWNMVDDTLYGGKGDNGSGTATSIVALAGAGAFMALSGTQTVDGAKTFSTVPKSSQDASSGTDLVRKSQFDAGLSGKAASSHSHAISDVTGLQSALDDKADTSHTHTIANVTGLQTALDAKAPLASPALTGVPTAPTASNGTNNTQVATTAFVQQAVTASSVAAISDIGDVTITSVADGEVFVYDSATSKWINQTLAEAGIAAASHTHSIANVTGLQSALDGKAATSHTHTIANVTGLQTALDAKAPLASPALTGTPTAPTAATATNNTQIATTAFVKAVVAALVDAAPGALDTLNELAAAIGDDPNFAATITTSVGEKLAKASNLSDLTNAASARSNLGLGSIATQAANNVSITGGSISGVDLDGGTF